MNEVRIMPWKMRPRCVHADSDRTFRAASRARSRSGSGSDPRRQISARADRGARYVFARAAVRDLTETPAPIACVRCGNRGLIRVEYHQGGPYDVAICDCSAGQWYDLVGEAGIRAIVGLGAAHRVAWIEAFEDEA